METNNALDKFTRAFPYMTDAKKLECFSSLVGLIRNDRQLMGQVCKMAERAYHPMLDIEMWLEARLTKNPSFTPKRVINECVIAMKLNRQMEPLLWGLARTVKRRVTRRIERAAAKCI